MNNPAGILQTTGKKVCYQKSLPRLSSGSTSYPHASFFLPNENRSTGAGIL